MPVKTDTANISEASIRNLNISPRKVRLVTDLVKGRPVNEALAQLQITSKRSGEPIAKLIRSAVSNAREKGLDANRLLIDNITVDKGKVLKRGLSRGRGRMTLVEKKQSHVNLTLREDKEMQPTGFVIHERPKKVKTQQKVSKEEKPKYEEEKRKRQEGKKPGFVKKFFQRKSV